jgi:heme A synthase
MSRRSNALTLAAPPLAISTLVATFALVLLGGVVHATGSSLACPDWPTCYGTLNPEMTGGILYEHSHRLLGTAVGLLTVALAVAVAPSARLRRWGFLALAIVIVQGVLGGLTVLFKLPPAISIAHLGTSMGFFALIVGIGFELIDTERAAVAAPARRLLALTAGAVYLQLLLGAAVRHLGAGLACPEWLLCGADGTLAGLQVTHRLAGLAVSGLIVLAAVRAFGELTGWRRLALVAMPVLVLAQLVFGAWSVGSYLGVTAVTFHLGAGALLWGTFALLFLSTSSRQS